MMLRGCWYGLAFILLFIFLVVLSIGHWVLALILLVIGTICVLAARADKAREEQ